MPERFGDVLRRARHDAEKTLGDVARLLGVSVVYVSDVERGNRRPFGNERILKIANFLDADPAPLITAADIERGVIEYVITAGKQFEATVVGDLVSGLARGGVTEDQLQEIRKILNDSDEGALTMTKKPSGIRADRGYSYRELERWAIHVRERLKSPQTTAINALKLFDGSDISTPAKTGQSISIHGGVIEMKDSEGYSKYDSDRGVIEILASEETYARLEQGAPAGRILRDPRDGTLPSSHGPARAVGANDAHSTDGFASRRGKACSRLLSRY